MSNMDSSFTGKSNYKNNHLMISQGGERKVMKKILSVALSTAMAFSMFASVAFGESGLTDVNAQYNYLKDKGIFTGYPDGQAHLDRNMTRAEFAKVITKTLGLKEITGVYSYNDKNYGANHWAAPYVEAVTAAGIMEGKNTTKKLFDLSGSVTVQEMATVLVRALDLEIPTETNNTASAWAKGYVQAAINAGLVDANANFQSNATRELLVGAAYAVDQEVSLQVESYTVSDNGKVVEFKMSDDQTVRVTLDQALVANEETPVRFTYNGKEFTHNVTYVVEAAAVQSVTAVNATRIAITFTQPVNAGTLYNTSTKVIEASALTITGLNGAQSVTASNLKGSLSADSKTLYVDVTGGSEYFDGNYAVEVLKDKVALQNDASTFIPEYNGLVNVNDTVAPSIESISYDGTDAVITLSEPIKSEGTVSLDGTQLVSGTGYTAVNPGDETITIKGLTSGKSYNLQVVGAKDIKGNIASPLTASLSVPNDTVKPTVNITTSGTKVTFKFSEELKGLDLDGTSSTTEYAKVTFNNGSANYLTAAEQDSTDKTKFVLDLASSVSGDFLTGPLKVEGFQDKSANAGEAVDTTVTLSKDKVAPEYVSATAKDNKLIVKFNEDVANNSLATSDLTVDFTDADGVLHTGATITTIGTVADKYDANGNGVIDGDEENYIVIPFEAASFLGTDGNLLPGSYKFTIAANKIKDTANNLITTATTFNVTVAKNTNTNAIVQLSTAVQQNTPGQIKVTFNNEMSSSALTASNYKLGGVTLPSDTNLVFVGDKKNVLITLPAGFVTANGDQVLSVANLTDKDGNTLKTDKTTATVTSVKENVAPTATKVSLIDGQNLTVDFSETLGALPGTVSGVKVKVNGVEIALDATTPFALNSTNKAVTIKANSASAFKLTDAISVEFSNTNITDLAGNAVKDVVLNK